MDHLHDLLNTAINADQPAGDQRVAIVAQAARSLEDSALPDIQTQARTEFDRLYASGDYDPGDVDTLEALADVAEASRVVASEREHRTHRAASAVERMRAADQPDTATEPGNGEGTGDGEGTGTGDGEEEPASGDGGGDSGTTPTDPENPDPDNPDNPDGPDTPPEGGDNPSGTAEPSTTSETTPQQQEGEPDTVAASAQRPATTAAINNTRNSAVPHTSEQPAKTLRSFSITASAEVPDTPYGKSLTMSELAEASAARFATFPVGEATSGTMKANVARVNRHYDESLSLNGDQSDVEKIDAVADEKRLPGGSVVAAAAQRTEKALTAATQAPSAIQDIWCTPSETSYDMCPPLGTTDGMLDLPTTGLPARGGIRYPVWNQYPDQPADWRGEVIQYPDAPADTGIDNPDYFRSTTDGGLGNTKRCIEGPCVTWAEERASLSYLCITSDIIRDRTFPEGLERFMSDVMVHHQHYLNETYINKIVANADPIPAFSVQNGAGAIGSSALTIIDRLALLVTWMRNRYKMADGATLEIIAPEWFREYLKRDLEKKQNRPFGAVSNAEVAALFAQYASRVQWVKDWQDMGDGVAVGGRIMPPDAWPASANILAYPAGSWVLSEGNVITLGVQYDHQLLSENRYSAMFSEDQWMLLNRCNRTFNIQLTELCANGAIGPQRDACAPADTTTTV